MKSHKTESLGLHGHSLLLTLNAWLEQEIMVQAYTIRVEKEAARNCFPKQSGKCMELTPSGC